MGSILPRGWPLAIVHVLGALVLLAAVHVSGPYDRVLRPAHYLSQCELYDPQPVPKIGQALFVAGETVPMLVYNEIAVSRSVAPFTPEAYILETKNDKKVFFVSRNDTIFRAKASSFRLLGGSNLTLNDTLPKIQPLLKVRQQLVFVPCFSKKWDGKYPPRSSQ